MNELQIFNFDDNEVRAVLIDDEPYFVGKDVAEVLGYSKPQNALAKHVEEDDALKRGIIDRMGRKQETTLINESGLYSLALSSKLPQAKKFKRWVTKEVLPNIRKHGAYMTEQTLEKALANPDFLIKLATELKEEKEKRKELETENNTLLLENKMQGQQIAELKPKADYTDDILKNKGLVTITAIAKDYGMSGSAMNTKLNELGVQYKQSGQWFLYAKHQNKGYTHSETQKIVHSDGREDIKMNTKWTQKGRLFIYELLKNNGIVPMIERS